MEAPPSYLPIAVRAYTVPARDEGDEPDSARTGRRGVGDPAAVLVFDTETTVDASQRLNFGSWRYFRVDWSGSTPRMFCVEEGLFYGDDLPDRYPRGYRALERYVNKRVPEVDRDVSDSAWRFAFLSQREFAEQVLVELGYRARAWIVGFNLPFDLSRCAVDASESRRYLPGGFSLTLAQYETASGRWREHRWRNRVAVKTLDSKRHLMGFKRRAEADLPDQTPEGESGPDPKWAFRGHFLDLRTLAFALTNENYSLERACNDFGVQDGKEKAKRHGRINARYIGYNRADVRATGRLFAKLMAEYKHHPIRLGATKAFSPASVGKAYLRAMGVKPVLQRQPDFPAQTLGRGMVAYYGGRAECRIRRTPVLVVYLDFLSMYPTVNSLMGMWDLVTAERVAAAHGTSIRNEAQELLDALTPDDCFRPETWRRLVGLVQLAPDGDVLPTRARYGYTASWGIGVNPLRSEQPLWYTLSDVAASKLLTGKAPRVLDAIRLEPQGRATGLKPVELPGAVHINPRAQDFFAAVIQERHRLDQRPELSDAERTRADRFLKVLANSSSYGIYAEVIRH